MVRGKSEGRVGGSTPKGERTDHHQKSKRVNRKGSKKKNRKMTIKSHHNPKRLDDEGLLVGTPQIYESTVGSSRPSGPHQCSAEMKAKL